MELVLEGEMTAGDLHSFLYDDLDIGDPIDEEREEEGESEEEREREEERESEEERGGEDERER
eukprot:CAMPEP_0119124976 /NCGR_PEP_ID=MMETSP1310-20130426/4416_1 /TAXON_ID=464262 /ORGANISM="Genus nov. species nov., Strain RCC2339" /LENGTH=62 /DNA_ID=CAMNT_0007114993 /DNA_START=60 /DNA_END=245 /DNA_ORIENTATION=-